ncbi:MAG: hypothetical protein KDD37_06050 [Bdellovibrionales bacterium]|nr:hypothetical protein [Bdellovibrionales bacterium]
MKNFVLVLMLPFLLSACGGGSGGGLDDLAGGGVEDVDAVTITQFLPSNTSVVIQQGSTVDFSVVAKAPPAQSINYKWTYGSTQVLNGSSAIYSITGGAGNIGTKTLKVVASDSSSSDELSWTVKVNGPPVLTPVTTGTPKVSVGDTTNITISAVDPNSDTLTYTWKLNGLTSPYLVGSTATAVLTGHASIVGSINISVTVSDGSISDTYTWTAEVNYFPTACNELAQGEVCTFAGSPSIGDGLSPASSQQGIRVSPINVALDDLNNPFFSDFINHVIWYWNKTASDVTRLNVLIPAGQIKVVAGTGEAASGPDGFAIESSLYQPRGLAYDQSTSTLYVAEYGGNKVKKITSSGVVSVGMTGTTHVMDGPAGAHRCDNPYDLDIQGNYLYVSCYTDNNNNNRVKRWNLTNDTARTFICANSLACAGEGAVFSTSVKNIGALDATADGLYVAAGSVNRIYFANQSGSTKTFWGTTNVNNNAIAAMFGNGTTNNTPQSAATPMSIPIAGPSGILVSGNSIFVSHNNSNRDGITVGNNTGAIATYGDISVASNGAQRLTFYSGADNMAGYNGSGVAISSARVNNPQGMVYDSSLDAIIFADYSNNRLRRLELGATSKITDMVGSGQMRSGFVGDVELPSTSHLFTYTSGLAYNATDRKLFFTDGNNYRVRQVDAYGRVSTAMGRGAGDPTIENDIPSNVFLRTNVGGNSYVSGLFSFSDGLLVNVNSTGNNIRGWNRTGADDTFFGQYILDDSVSTLAGDYLLGAGYGGDSGAATSAQFNNPNDVAGFGTGASRVLYISDHLNHCIRKVDSAGIVTTVVGICGNTSNGTSNLGGLTVVTLNRPSGIVTDSLGNLYIADRNNHKIRYANFSASPVTVANVTIPAGQIGTVGCNNGSTGSANENVLSIGARCNTPQGIAQDSTKVCFSQQARHNVRCINKSTGIITTVLGSLESTPVAGSPLNYSQEGVGGTDARLYNPSSIVFDDVGDLYVCDQYNHIIRKLKMSP